MMINTLLFISIDNDRVFFVSPVKFLNIRVKMVMPSFTTLLALSSWEHLCNLRPILGIVDSNLVDECTVFSNSP